MNDQINQEVTVILLKKIIELLDEKEPALESVSVDNLDVVSASLRNELAKVVKAVKDNQPDNTDVLKELKKLYLAIEKLELNPTINVSAADVTMPDIKVPDITIPSFDIPTPQVTVNPPEIHIPAPVVNLPAPVVNVESVDLSNIIRALEVNLNKLRTNSETRPLAVRLSDGQKWVKQLEQLNKQTAQTVQYMSDVSYIRNAAGIRINPATSEEVGPPRFIGDGYKAVTTAGVKEALASSTQCRYVIIMALSSNTGNIYIGGTTVSSTSGRALVSLQSEKIDIDNLNKIYIDSDVNGEGVMYTYVA